MKDGLGEIVSNDSGHKFRCKSCHGWDYKGENGVYGSSFQNKKYVASDLFKSESKSVKQFVRLIEKGAGGMPAFEGLMPIEEIENLAVFLKKGAYDTDIIFTLDPGQPYKYVLSSNGDAKNGLAQYEKLCQSCHGPEGLEIMFDDDSYSLGTHARLKA